MNYNNNLYVDAEPYEVDPILNRNNPGKRQVTDTTTTTKPTGITGKIKNMFNKHPDDRNYDYNRNYDYDRSYRQTPNRSYDFVSNDKTRYDWDRSNRGDDVLFDKRTPYNQNYTQDYYDSGDYSNRPVGGTRSMFDKNYAYRHDNTWNDDNWNKRSSRMQTRRGSNSSSSSSSGDDDNDRYRGDDWNTRRSTKLHRSRRNRGYDRDYNDWNQPSYGQPSYGQPSYGQSSWGQPSYGRENYGYKPSLFERIGSRVPGNRGYDRDYDDWNQPSWGQSSWGQPSYGRENYGYKPSLFERIGSRVPGNRGYDRDYTDWNQPSWNQSSWGDSGMSGMMPNQFGSGGMMQNMFNRLPMFKNRWSPNIDICEDLGRNLYTICVELPGVNKNDVRVDIDNERLIISGNKNFLPGVSSTQPSGISSTQPPPLPTGMSSNISSTQQGGIAQQISNIFKNECTFGSFFRTIILPRGVDSTQIQAWLENGLLHVVVPKPSFNLGRPGINIGDTNPYSSQQQTQQPMMNQNVKVPLSSSDNTFSLGSQQGKQTKI